MDWQTIGAYLHLKHETYEARCGLADHHHCSLAQMPASDIEKKKEHVVSLASDVKQNNTANGVSCLPLRICIRQVFVTWERTGFDDRQHSSSEGGQCNRSGDTRFAILPVKATSHSHLFSWRPISG